jgi:pectate lyase
MLRHILFTIVVAISHVQAAGYIGNPLGFGRDTTGGGDAPAQVPASNDELIAWLTDAKPRTILIDRVFDFVGSEGECDNCAVCANSRCASNTGQSGQWIIDVFKTGCKDRKTFLNGKNVDVKSNKSIVGLDNKGVLRGLGLRFVYGVSNIIVQNVHLTQLNPEYVWGGDAIYMNGCNKIWIDHVKFSLAGRQFISMGFDSSE